MRIIKRVKSIKKTDNFYNITTNACDIRLYFLTDAIVRIRAGFDGDFKEESYSLVTTAWEDRLDHVLGEDRKQIDVADTNFKDDEESATISSDKTKLIINKKPFTIEVYNQEGTLLHRDIPELAYRCDSNNRRFHTSEILNGDCFYGFGEKTGNLNKLGQFMTMSPNDTMGYDPVNSDSLYKHIPFYIKANKYNKNAVGYFYHNMRECTFDMGKSHSNYWKHHSTYQVDGGDIDLFLMVGDNIKDVVYSYTFLTGRSALLPKYALGYLGSSMYYSELKKNCDDAILHFIDTAIEEEIPIDGFQLSSGYTAQDTKNGEKRCVFTWNKDRFEDPEKFFEEMKKRGITVSPNVKPGILLTHPDIDKFTSKDILVKDSNDETYATGCWWGGEGVFADFTNPVCREEWKKLLKENVINKGTSSVWNDNCEYDSIVDKDARVSFDEEESTIGQTRTVQSNLMCRITREAVEEAYDNTRPFIVCRSGHSGIQSYAQSWAGDNRTSWDTLKYNMSTILGMSMCGVSNYGADIGGFYGDAPSPELLVRWVQAGIFMPRFSIHSVNTDNTVTEPWMYPEYTHFIRDAIQFRYRLFPYMYSLMAMSHEKGDMILNPLMAAFPDDENCYETYDSFMLGGSLYVGNVLEKGASMINAYLPNGVRYYGFSYENDHLTGDVYEGGKAIDTPVELASIPLFLTSGAIMPIAGNQLMNLTLDTLDCLHILCVADKDSLFTYYEDDGISYDYKKNIYHKMHIDMKSGTRTALNFTHEGDYKSTLRSIELEVASPYNCPFEVSVEGSTIPQFLRNADYENAENGWYYNIKTKTTMIKYHYIDTDYSVIVNYENFDMLGM